MKKTTISKTELETLRTRFMAVMEFLNTPMWKVVAPEMFKKESA